jgi:hypothetical protein
MTPSPGRPPTGAVQIKRTVSLDDATVEKLRAYGGGYLSVGIRRAAELIPLPGDDGMRKGVD